MRARWTHDGDHLRLDLALDPEDPVQGRGQGTMTVGLLAREATVRLPRAVETPHPDLLALAAYVITRPWTTRRLRLAQAVSPRFAEVLARLTGVEVSPVDDALAPRAQGSRIALMYSSGADSVAASALLPNDVPHIHHRRVPHPRVPDRATHVQSAAIENLVQEAGRRGRDVHVVRTDLEYLCHPFPTLPSWFAIGVGALLLADDLDLGALALGGTLETLYMDMGRSWHGRRGRGIDEAVEAAGVSLVRPTVGLTEVSTMRLAVESDLADLSRSCVLGTFDAACGRCSKCVRKDLLVAALGDGMLPESLTAPDVSPDLRALVEAETPIYMQAQLEYALARTAVRGTPLEALHERLRPDPADTGWMERAYAPALEDGVAEPWRDGVREQVAERVGFMTDADVAAAVAWSR